MSTGQKYFDTLKVIARFDSIKHLERNSEKVYGLSYHEALEMVYESIRRIAGRAVRGKRRPKE